MCPRAPEFPLSEFINEKAPNQHLQQEYIYCSVAYKNIKVK